MARDCVLVVDAGSSALRCRLVDERGRIRATASRAWRYLDEPDAPELARAFDPDACRRDVLDAIAECASAMSAMERGDRISAVSVTSQRQSLVSADANGDALYAGPNTDLRAAFEGAALDFAHGDTLYRATGHKPAFMMASGKLRWFAENRPRDFDRIAQILPLADWLARTLTGESASERTLAAASGMVDLRSRDWARAEFERAGVRAPFSRMALADAAEPRGEVTAPGVPSAIAGLPVVVAGGDTQCALLGLGIAERGMAGIVAGWSATVQILASAPIVSPDMDIWTGLFQRADLWALESSAGDAGGAYSWLARTVFGGESASVYAEMDALASAAPVGSGGARAHLGARRMDVSSLGMSLGGVMFPVPMALESPTRAHMARAALEGFAYALRANLEQAERVSGGGAAAEIAFGGGMARSRALRRILADVLGRRIYILADGDSDATASGAALIARTALGQYESLSEAAQAARANRRIIEPNPQVAAEYEGGYGEWQERERKLEDALG